VRSLPTAEPTPRPHAASPGSAGRIGDIHEVRGKVRRKHATPETAPMPHMMKRSQN
jgi:hypothetical protein